MDEKRDTLSILKTSPLEPKNVTFGLRVVPQNRLCYYPHPTLSSKVFGVTEAGMIDSQCVMPQDRSYGEALMLYSVWN